MNSNSKQESQKDNDDNLRALAEAIAEKNWHAARPDHCNGWWVVSRDKDGCDTIDDSADGGFSEATAKFVAAACPAQILNLLNRLEAAEKACETFRATWPDAYAAFKGAFDTPVARRKVDDEYAIDARQRMAAFNALLRKPPEEALPAPEAAFSTSKAHRSRQTI